MLNVSLRQGIVAGVASGLVLAGAALAVADGPSESMLALRAAASNDAPTVAVGQLQPAILDNFALFRNRAASGMPGDAEVQVGSAVRYGRDASLARAIDTVTGTGWMIPGDGYLCIAVPDPVDGYGTSCVPTDVAAERGVAISLVGNLPGDKVAETVVVPDGREALQGPAGQERSVDTAAGVASVWSDTAGDLRVAGS
jgi:hypothetical protein